jgi:hypothetical protein
MKVKLSQFKSLSLILIVTVILSLVSFSSARAEDSNRTVLTASNGLPSGAECDQDPYCHKIDPGYDTGSWTAPGPITAFYVKAGSNLIEFLPGQTYTSGLQLCWTVTFSGATVSWSRNSNSSTCQNPSHFEITWEDGNYASAEATVLACVEGHDTEPVYLSVDGATMKVTGQGIEEILNSGESGTYYDWPMGTYAITYYDFDAGVSDPGDLPDSFTIGDCSQKQDAEAKAKVEACTTGATTTPVSLSVTGATMNITGPKNYSLTPGTSEVAKDWPVGTYAISYVLEDGYNDPGNLPKSFTIENCAEKEDAGASATVEACETGSKSTPVILWVEGATMHITMQGDASFAMDHTGGPTPYNNLEPGTYSISYTIDADHKDPGNLPTSFVVEECEKDKGFADLSITVTCQYDPDNTCHRWTVSNPNDFSVEFEWSTGAKSSDYAETGSGTVDALGKFVFNTSYVSQTMVLSYSDGEVVQVVTVDTGVCATDHEDPDEPAGGNGPSLMVTLTPALLIVSGIAVAWMLIKHRIKSI